MSSIVKAAAVVDDRAHRQSAVITGLFPQSRPVIKRQAVSSQDQYPQFPDYLPAMGEQAYTEQINRIRLQMEEAKEELRGLTGSLESAREELARLKREQELLESVREVGVDAKVQQMLEDAEKQATFVKDRMLRESEEASAEIRSLAYQEGLEQGQAKAYETFQAQHRQDIDKISTLLESLSGSLEEQVRKNESQIVSLAVAIAEKIVGTSLKEKPQRVTDMLREVLEDNRREAYIKVTISPDLMPAQARVNAEVLEFIRSMGEQIDLHVEATMDPGSLVVETPKGLTDLSIPTQLENMENTLQQSLTESEEE